MKTFFETIPQNVFRIFTGRNLVWQVVAIFLTMVFVVMGLDWIVYEFFFKSFIYGWFFPGAGFLGFILPLTIPLSLLLTPLLYGLQKTEEENHQENGDKKEGGEDSSCQEGSSFQRRKVLFGRTKAQGEEYPAPANGERL